MGCCGLGSNEQKQNNNNLSDIEKLSGFESLTKNILTWGLVIVLIIALAAWLV